MEETLTQKEFETMKALLGKLTVSVTVETVSTEVDRGRFTHETKVTSLEVGLPRPDGSGFEYVPVQLG